MSALSGLLVDVRPLRQSPTFRRLWAGNFISGFGTTMAAFTISWVVWERTHSAAAVGLIGLAQLVPMVVFTLLGGHWADRYDRRRLIIAVRVAQVVAAAVLAALVILTAHAVWPLFALIAVESALSSIGQPVTQTFIASIVDDDQRAAAYAINHTSGQVTMLLGPLAAGLALAAWGPAWCMVFDAASFLASVYGVWGLPRLGRPESGDAPASAARQIAAGVRFVARTPIVAALLLADLNATVLAMPVALFPVLNSQRFGGSPVTLGLLLPALGLGGVLAGFLSGRITSARRQGVVMIVASGVWGAAIAGAGLVPWLPAVLVLLAITGAADVASVVSRSAIIQSVTPDAYRGRVNSLDFLVGAGGPKLGDIRAGLVADASSAAFSMFVGGAVSAALAVVIAAAVPSLRRYRASAGPLRAKLR
ncbi:MFS transporter [Gryllotalpicola ginsengisoli]|uniref:MFS transporter n=1 Tax=Gryllotalpicola ginsengisoli TaxID=444608 RepID=UPI0003B532AC|nr:MFS transporter [Gryllotalpicola ginsengisoli]